MCMAPALLPALWIVVIYPHSMQLLPHVLRTTIHGYSLPARCDVDRCTFRILEAWQHLGLMLALLRCCYWTEERLCAVRVM